MSNDVMVVNCPTCGTDVEWGPQSQFRPFCSKRCQLIDLGEWADEKKAIPSDRQITDSDDWSEDQR
ncbi:DNA gyrase inhibitor YacG [Sodalis sp. RH21]|uniref:DNA gyrase inhibitor YacG n=1 Tax=unclassified Sodalis (in: enterobacteria) TaxID=2636512 RepID=UPI0039B4877E